MASPAGPMALLASNNSNSNLHQPFDRFRHSRSSSTSSTHSAGGHHLSSQSANLNHLNFPTDDHVYRAPFNYAHDGQTVPPSLTRHSSTASTRSNSHSLASTGITSPENSPPTDNNPNPGVKMQPTSIRNARTLSNTPYAREYHYHSGSESVRSSSSEADDIAVFLAQSPGDYPTYVEPSMYNQEAANAAGAFGRMTLDPKQTLLQLAANVQAATTTSASDRAKQIFVQAWLQANYAPYPDGNVPRQGLYNSYRRVCDEYQIPHINTATLGKAIRLCFPAIKTRRLGVRGNSKYHYCGIRPATAAEAEWLKDFVRRTNNHNPVNSSGGRSAQNSGESHSDEEDEGDSESSGHRKIVVSISDNYIGGGLKSPTLYGMDEKTPTTNSLLSAAQDSARTPVDPYRTHAQIRRRSTQAGDESTPLVPSAPHDSPSFVTPGQPHTISVRSLRNFPSIEEALGTSSSPHGLAAREVWRWFEDHLDGLLEAVRSFRFDQFEMHLRTFWASLSGDYREVVHAPAVAGLMGRADAIVYDEILEILRSHILSPIPVQALTSLRQLADKMEKILLLALDGYGNTFVEPKVELGARFGHLVLRFLDIFQVTQALNTVLNNHKQVDEMRRAWRDVDFESVRNQAALVCNCRHEDLVQLLEVDFVAILDGLNTSREPAREMMQWADNCCDRLMGGNNAAPGERSTMSSRSVLIRWGYVTSQIMRDFTIRSDPAFGAFQILKLFLDDWIALSVLRTVALSTNSVAASVEPVMQQQFLTSSPLTSHFSSEQQQQQPHHMMNDHHHLPGMSESYPQFNSNAFYGPMDGQNEELGMHHHPGMSFADYATPGGNGESFDMGSFTHDLNLPTRSSSEAPLDVPQSVDASEGLKEEPL